MQEREGKVRHSGIQEDELGIMSASHRLQSQSHGKRMCQAPFKHVHSSGMAPTNPKTENQSDLLNFKKQVCYERVQNESLQKCVIFANDFELKMTKAQKIQGELFTSPLTA